jgi:hypothetical protein
LFGVNKKDFSNLSTIQIEQNKKKKYLKIEKVSTNKFKKKKLILKKKF